MAGSEIIGKEELLEIQELFDKDRVVLYRYGPNNYKTKKFEKLFAEYIGVKYAHAVSSGTAAIHSALAAIDVDKGDEVITTAWTFVAPIEAIVALGATPVLVNIDETFNLDPFEIEKAITSKTKAIVVVPMWSAPRMDLLTKIANNNNISLVEDAAQSLGASYNGKKLGTFGKVGSFSFDFGKTLNTGEGGMIVTNDKEVYDKAAEFSDHGHMHKLNIPRGKDPRRKPGLNYRISELTSAVGIGQLRKIDYILSESKKNKYIIKNELKDMPGLKLRKFDDEDGAQGDTLIFSLENHEKALLFEKVMNQNGLGTKILPEAIDWHFAGVWTHILPQFEIYHDIDLEKKYKKTGDLLRRSICLNIPINIDKQQLENYIKVLLKALEAINDKK
tara:strand:+ start:106 stop:1272 length:1167 start_codon:yes stop_codon:yes gene_type:complete